jgi:hypothetical protein
VQSPFISLDRRYFGSDTIVRAEFVVYIELVRVQSGSKVTLGLHGGGTLDSFLFPPDDQTLASLRQIRDQIMNDITEKLQPDAPSWRALPAGAE